jgi:hypothetical protein
MLRGNKELWLACLAMLLITGLYGLVIILTHEIPPASELFGHGMGIVGFVMMLMTETLYSLRKRSRSVRWGRMGLLVLIWCCFIPLGSSTELPELPRCSRSSLS